MANIRDAIRGYLGSLKKHGEPIPLDIFIDLSPCHLAC